MDERLFFKERPFIHRLASECMSDKVRVMFEVPPGTKHRDRLSKPVEIPIEKYIEFKMGMRDGYNGEMAAYVGETFLKGTVVSSDEIKMITAVGNSQALLDIDAQRSEE
ncbi:hypothetical protein, partial [uncultured Duncaniella sp.]|uniref:hypothetical protein n=1 Tax=uncultured Duncaniella sp. TaxID=2768039 RepID=UPI002648FEFC